jgi:proteic killer suppression protein
VIDPGGAHIATRCTRCEWARSLPTRQFSFRTTNHSTLGVLWCYPVIRSFADETTRDVWNGVNSKAVRRIPRQLWPNVRRKLDQIDAVTRLDDLKVPPGNRLHALGADLRGFHAVRVNDQYRIVFRFEGGDAFDVQCTDYH